MTIEHPRRNILKAVPVGLAAGAGVATLDPSAPSAAAAISNLQESTFTAADANVKYTVKSWTQGRYILSEVYHDFTDQEGQDASELWYESAILAERLEGDDITALEGYTPFYRGNTALDKTSWEDTDGILLDQESIAAGDAHRHLESEPDLPPSASVTINGESVIATADDIKGAFLNQIRWAEYRYTDRAGKSTLVAISLNVHLQDEWAQYRFYASDGQFGDLVSTLRALEEYWFGVQVASAITAVSNSLSMLTLASGVTFTGGAVVITSGAAMVFGGALSIIALAIGAVAAVSFYNASREVDKLFVILNNRN